MATLPAPRPTPRRGPADDAEVLVEAHGVSKRFQSYQRRATSLKERLVRREGAKGDVFWALRGVDVQVRRGETVGLMGPNGSGKSTLLKVLSGILRPNEGEVAVHGRVASLLELGAGFDGELTGRENIYLNSALLGIPRSETDALFDDIVEFSELGEFIEFPVKHYSSGMYVRLGFAVAVHVDPDILIVDEVLAVGDAAFQTKCLMRIEEFQRQGKTLLLVSHSAGLIEQLCTRSVLLRHGEVVFDGSPGEAVARLNAMLGVDQAQTISGERARVHSMTAVDPSTRQPITEYFCGAPALVLLDLEWLTPLEHGANLSLHFNAPGNDQAIEVLPLWHRLEPEQIEPGLVCFEWLVDALPDLPGDFSINIGVYSDDELVAHGKLDGVRLRGATRHVIAGSLTLSTSRQEVTDA